MFNPYPEETLWRKILPEKSPLCILEYGLMTELIVPLVIQYRLKFRNDRVKYLINNTHNDRLLEMIRYIKNIYKKYFNDNIYIHPYNGLPITRYTFYQYGGGTGAKYKKIKWYIKSDLPLIYLENAHKKHINGPPKYKLNDHVIYKGYPYVITKVPSGNNRVNYEAMKMEYKKHVIINYKDKNCSYKGILWDKPIIIFRESIGYCTLICKLNPWMIYKVEESTINIINKRNFYIKNVNIDIQKRVKFWNDYILPLFPDNTICYRTWIMPRIDVWNLKSPPPAIHFSDQMRQRWNLEWTQIISKMETCL